MPTDNDLLLLHTLLQQKPSALRKTTLLDALELTRREVPQSLFLAWLLGAQGPLTNFWLLKTILNLASPTLPWPGTPQSVLPEVAVDSERADIVAEWESFKLIIEYKVDSPEGTDQVNRYLRTFKVAGTADGIIVYLTPSGKWPASVSPGDPRVYPMAFRRLIECLDDGLSRYSEENERGKALAAEYRDCLRRVLNRSINMTKPVISEATKLLSQHHQHFDRLMAATKQEAADVIEYLAARAEEEMRRILGPEMIVSVLEDWGYFMFRKPNWKTPELEFGIAYGCEGKLGSRTMHEYGHNLSVRVQPLAQRSARVKPQRAFTESLRVALMPHIPGKVDGSNQWFAFWQELPFKPEADWMVWAEDVVKKLSQLARVITTHIDRFAAELE